MNSPQKGSFPLPSLRAGMLAITLLTALAYTPILRADFLWDDAEYVTANPAVLEPGGIARIWLEPDSCPYYYPTTFTAFWLQNRIWGLHPLGYHLVNVGLHILNACLFVLALDRLKFPNPILAGMIFALHPVQSASVAWVTELKNVLSGTLYLSTLLLWLGGKSRCGAGWSAAIVLFLFAMLAKPVVCSLPIVLCLLVWWKGEATWRRDLWMTAPFFAIAVGISLFTLAWESGRKIAVDPLYDLSWVERILLSSQSLVFYMAKLLWPDPLAAVYPRWEVGADSPMAFLIPLGLAATFSILWGFRDRIGKGPLVAALGVAVTLGPLLGVVNFSGMVYSHVYTHHLYHATPFFAALLAAPIGRAIGRTEKGIVLVGTVLAFAILLAYGLLAWKQAAIHRNGETLFEHNISVFPEAPQPRVFLGNHHLELGQSDEAIDQYESALRLSPLDPQAHYGLAEALVRTGDSEGVLEHLEKAVEGGPTYSAARFNLAWAHRNRGDHTQAVEHFSELIRFRPSYWSAYLPLAESLGELGREEEALATLEAVLEIRPEYADAEHRLALMLLERDEIERAILHFERTLQSDPDRGFRTKPEFARLLVEKSRAVRGRAEEDRAEKMLAEAKRIWPRVSDGEE